MARDRFVDPMSTRGRLGVVSVFLNGAGRVESASNKACEFRDAYFSGGKRVDDYPPPCHGDYLQGAIRFRESSTAPTFKNESLVSCFGQESGAIDCLLRKMGRSGYLLSLALSR